MQRLARRVYRYLWPEWWMGLGCGAALALLIIVVALSYR